MIMKKKEVIIRRLLQLWFRPDSCLQNTTAHPDSVSQHKRFELAFAVPHLKLGLNLLIMFSNDFSVFFLFQSGFR
jgi:hypothetical protein